MKEGPVSLKIRKVEEGGNVFFKCINVTKVSGRENFLDKRRLRRETGSFT